MYDRAILFAQDSLAATDDIKTIITIGAMRNFFAPYIKKIRVILAFKRKMLYNNHVYCWRAFLKTCW